MLASAETIEMVVNVLRAHPDVPAIVDPVLLISTCGLMVPSDAVR